MYIWSFPGGTVVKNPPANAGDPRDMGSVPELGRSPGVETELNTTEKSGYPNTIKIIMICAQIIKRLI